MFAPTPLQNVIAGLPLVTLRAEAAIRNLEDNFTCQAVVKLFPKIPSQFSLG